jgi:hypothetical protein
MEKHRVIFGRDAVANLDTLVVPLEIDRTVVLDTRIQDVFLIIYPEEIPVDEIEFLPELIALHKNLIELFRTRQWWQCLELVAVLHGRWNGIADNFYASVLERIEMYADNPPPETWLGEFWEPESNTT